MPKFRVVVSVERSYTSTVFVEAPSRDAVDAHLEDGSAEVWNVAEDTESSSKHVEEDAYVSLVRDDDKDADEAVQVTLDADGCLIE